MANVITVFLKDEKLRQLADVMASIEVSNMWHISFPNIGEQLDHFRMINGNAATIKTVLDECNFLVNRYQSDSVRSPIAGQVLVYAEHCINNALQLFQNFTLRKDYLDKMTDHHHQIFQALEDLDTSNRSAADELAETIREYDRMVVAYLLLNLNKHASAEFSQNIRNMGISFDELVRNNQANLGYTGLFEDLEDEQKLEVYLQIVDESGRLSVLPPSQGLGEHELKKLDRSYLSYSRKKAMWGSAAMFLMDMGVIIWDLYSSGHTLTEATRAAVVAAAEAGGAALGQVVGAAIATQLTGQAATTLFVTAVGMAAGIVGAFIFGALAGFLFDLIFSSGGQKEIPTTPRVYVAPMPDGHALARQLA